jgi:hypothetical protein
MHKLLLYSILGFLLIGCSTFKLESNKRDNNTTHFEEFNDFLLFKFRTNIVLKKDMEILKPTPFDLNLPKKIRYWEVINSSNFGFYYNQDQVVFVTTVSSNKLTKGDKVYIPQNKEIEDLINDDLATSGNHKWDIKNIAIKQGRKNLLIIDGETKIFLFNIKEKNFEYFLKLVKSYKKIE